MVHQVFTGPFSALERRLVREVIRQQGGDPLAPVAVLVGSNLLAVYLRRRFGDCGMSVANLRFVNFLDLVCRLAEDSGAAGAKARLPHLGPAEIIDSVLRANAPPAFITVADLQGFRDALLDTFRDLRDAGVSPATLEGGIRECLAATPDRRGHLDGLAHLYRLFRTAAQEFRDVDADFGCAVERAGRAPALLGTTRLFVYGVYDATGRQLELLEALRQSLELCFFIPYVNDSVSDFARPFADTCASMTGAEIEAIVAEPPGGDLGELWRRDFGFGGADSPAATRADGSFRMISAPGESRAAVEIVREVLGAAHDGVIAGFYDAAVVLRHPESQVAALAEAFRLRGIPCYFEGGSSLADSPIGRAVLAIADLEEGSFGRPAVLNAMELAAAALPTRTAELWNVPDWRALTNDPRFLSGSDAWNRGTQALLRETEREVQAAEAAASEGEDEERSAPPLPHARRRRESAQSLRQAWKRVQEAAAGWPQSLAWPAWADFLEERLAPLLHESDGWSEFSRVIDELRVLGAVAGKAGGGGKVSRTRFRNSLARALEGLSLRQGRFQRSGVHFLSTASARGLRFPLVIIPGLEEGGFPARLRQDPLLLDDERRRIGRPPRLPLRALRGEEEKLLFDMTARSAAARLVLVTSRLDESSDRERIPSEFLLRPASAVAGGPLGIRDLQEGKLALFRSVGLENPAPAGGLIAVDRGEIRLRCITAEPSLAREALEELAQEEPALLSRPMAYDRARWLRKLTEYDGRIRNPDLCAWVIQNAGPAAGPVSASRLEEYARCPYLFFLKRVIGIEGWEEEEPPFGLDPMERGSIVHEVLEKFLFRFCGEGFPGTAMAEMENALTGILCEILGRRRPPGIPDLLWALEQERVEHLLGRWLDFERERLDEGFLPRRLEWSFGAFSPRDASAALRIDAGRHRFEVRGRIDRIDFTPDGKRARVIDYKVGKLAPCMAARRRPLLMAGEKIQIAVYREAMARLAGAGQGSAISGEYLHLQHADGQIKTCSFSPEELEVAGRRLVSMLEIIGDGVERGIFPHRPAGSVYPDNCTYCEYKSVCGKEKNRRAERKSADPDAARMLDQCDPPVERDT